MLQAVRTLLPGVKLTGCLFHFTQCVYKKVQELGLQRDYRCDAGTRTVVKRCMALPLLPHEHIPAVCNESNNETLRILRTTWIVGTVFTPPDWTCYNQRVRMNNDLEGWHYRLNHGGRRANLQFYLMCKLMYEEAVTVSIIAELVYREDVTKSQTNGSKRSTEKLLRMWREYRGGQRSA